MLFRLFSIVVFPNQLYRNFSIFLTAYIGIILTLYFNNLKEFDGFHVQDNQLPVRISLGFQCTFGLINLWSKVFNFLPGL